MRFHHAFLGVLAAFLAALVAFPSIAAAQAQNQTPNQDYVAMGDSYSSGNGAGTYYESTCYRSVQAYGPLIDPQIPGTFSHPACSGARTQHIDINSQNGFPKQIDLLGPNTDYVSLTIGGNDAGFTSALQQCAIPLGGCNDSGGELDQAEAFIQGQLPALLDRNFAAIRQRAPNATVSVLGYPRIFRPNQTCIAVFSTAEVNRANELADQLADVTRDRALAAGFSFVDARPAFLGHGSCDSDNWIHEFQVGDVSGSFHPTLSGYVADAGLVRATLLASPKPGQVRGANGRIAFASNRTGNDEVFAVHGATGGFPVNVTQHPAADIDPAWSPDGKKLAFASNRDGDNEIYVLDFDAGGLTKLTNNTADDREPAWSPNGELIAFRSMRDGNNEIYSMTATGGSQTNLTRDVAASDFAPAWSPDGSEIAFQRFLGNNEVMRMNADGQGITNLSSNSANDGGPTWSPDGRTVAFHSSRDGDFELFTMTRAGTAVTQRTANTTHDQFPSYSPDGASIAFTAARDGNDEIYARPATAPAGPGAEVRLTDHSGADALPSWQGDATPPRTTIDPITPEPLRTRLPTIVFGANEPGASFQCRIDGGSFSPCASPLQPGPLSDGQHTVEVRATDLSGNAETSPASRTFTVEVPQDATALTAAPPSPTNDPTPTFEFGSPVDGTAFECSLDGGDWESCSSPYTAPELADGDHSFRVRGTPPEGETGVPAVAEFTVDTTAAITEITAPPASLSAETAPIVEFAAGPGDESATFECRLDGGGWEPCASPHELGPLDHGDHSFEVRATDGAGNVEANPASVEFRVDIVAPVTTVEPVASPSPSRRVTIEFAGEADALLECRLDSADEAAWAPCSSPFTTPRLPDGEHTFDVRATDPLGNVEDPHRSVSFVVDAKRPETTIDEGAAARIKSARPLFAFSSDDLDARFRCQLSGETEGEWEACDGTYEPTEPLGDGSYTFTVKALDDFDKEDASPAVAEFVVDTAAPTVSITDAPPARTNRLPLSFSFTADDDDPAVNLECRLDDGDWEETGCASPYEIEALPDGAHTFAVRASDSLGNAATATAEFDLRTQPPATEIDSGPAGRAAARGGEFSFSSPGFPGATFECKLGGDWEECTSPFEFSDLPDGGHTFSVRALDGYGNEDATPAIREFVVDTVAPVSEFSSGPVGPTADVRPRFTFRASEQSTSECTVDGTNWSPCQSPWSPDPLPDGEYRAQVRATDEAGNREATPPSRAFSVDTQVTAPSVSTPKKVKVRKRISIPIAVYSGEATSVSATGSIAVRKSRVALPPKSLALLARARGGLKLAPAKRGGKLLKRALTKRKPLKATVSVQFTDLLGNTTSVQRSVKLLGKPKR